MPATHDTTDGLSRLMAAPDARPRLRDGFELDLRSLALFRIGLAAVVIGDLLDRSPDLRHHYSDWGVLPRAAAFQLHGYWLSFHAVNGSTWWQGVLFLLAGLFALMLLVGWRTRLATAASWALLISLHNRNPVVIHGGDVVERLLLFWAMFLPLGARWSVDAARNTLPRPASDRFISVGAVALVLQVCLIYWFNAINKHDWIWWNGEAVAYALNLDQFATSLGLWLRQFPTVMQWMTWTTLVFELVVPALAISPLARTSLRTLAVVGFWAFHIGLGACLELGSFPWVCAVAWAALLPSGFWQWLARCEPASAAAAARLASAVGHRIRAVFPPRPYRLRPCVAAEVAAAFFFIYALMWNVREIDFAQWGKRFELPRLAAVGQAVRFIFPPQLNVIANVTRVDQLWSMFAPFPSTDDGWYVVPGTLRDGSEVDLWNGPDGRGGRGGGGTVSYEKPKRVADNFPNSRWRKLMLNLYDSDTANHRVEVGRYLCRRWNESHEPAKQVMTFKLIYMRERTLSTTTIAKPKPIMLWQHWCFEMPPQLAPTTASAHSHSSHPASAPTPAGK